MTSDFVHGISSMATRRVLAELGEAYERASGQRVAVVSAGGVDAARRVQDGEAFDFVVLSADAIDRLSQSGHVDARSRTDLARSDIAVAVAAGADKPDATHESGIRDAVLHARTIGYSTGPSGTHLARLFDRWGIADEIASRLVQAPPGIGVGTLIARGDVEIGFQQWSEFMHVPEIDIVGPLPPEIQSTTLFSGAVCRTSARPADARALLAYLASPAADAVKQRHGMRPARNDP